MAYENEEWWGLLQDSVLELEHAKTSGHIDVLRIGIVARLEKLREMPRFKNGQRRRAIEKALQELNRLEDPTDETQEKQIAEKALESLRALAPASVM
jgi:hypothetical protein